MRRLLKGKARETVDSGFESVETGSDMSWAAGAWISSMVVEIPKTPRGLLPDPSRGCWRLQVDEDSIGVATTKT